MTWHEAWGTWKKSPGVPADVAMVGGPQRIVRGLDTTRAKQAGYGHGIRFTSLNNEGTSVKIELNLIGMTSNNGMFSGSETGYLGPGNSIYSPGWDYNWLVNIEYSTDGGRTYTYLKRDVMVATHSTPQGLAYNDSGTAGIKHWSRANVRWSSTVTLPSNFTHLRFEVKGDEPAERNYNIYTREIVVPPPPPPPAPTTLKPWAIRKSGSFKTLDRQSGLFQIRKSGTFQNKSDNLITDVNQPNKGKHRVRKGSNWVGQNKIGGQ